MAGLGEGQAEGADVAVAVVVLEGAQVVEEGEEGAGALAQQLQVLGMEVVAVLGQGGEVLACLLYTSRCV